VGPFFVSNRFLPGHRIALEVSSSSVPRYERNMNTGGANFDEARGRPAMNSVHLGGDRASFLTIPLLNDASMKRAAPFH
jgi:predicted acyl esterase